MKVNEIRDLIDFISQSPLDEVNIETEEFKISVKRNTTQNVVAAAPIIQQAAQPIAPIATPATPQATTTKEETTDTSNYLTIKSPMIGTFYRSPNPESPTFVNIGDEVTEGKTVCIIEAMKLFNEIESEVSGRIVKVLVENATPVEYDQPLFLVEPNN